MFQAPMRLTLASRFRQQRFGLDEHADSGLHQDADGTQFALCQCVNSVRRPWLAKDDDGDVDDDDDDDRQDEDRDEDQDNSQDANHDSDHDRITTRTTTTTMTWTKRWTREVG